MTWQGGDGVWASGDWKSRQYTMPGGDEVYDYSFFDGDLVYFNDTADPGESYTVTLDYNAIVSGMDVNMASPGSEVTITGTGGITAYQTNPGTTEYIIGKYANKPPTPGGQEFDTTGKLVKKGVGILTFANTGSNTFTEGIDINSGTVKFNDGRQLQVGSGKALTFTGNGALQATSTAKLETDVVINTGIVASFGTTLISDTLILDGPVSGPGYVEVISGTVQLNRGTATFTGETIIENGTLRLLEGLTYETVYFQVRPGDTSVLAGAGTYQADTTWINGRISPDTYKDDVIDGVVQARTGDKFAKLTIDGGGPGRIANLNGFTFDYDAKEANTTTGAADTPNDLLKFTNMIAVTIGDGLATDDVGTINFRTGDENYLAAGKYLIIDSNTVIMLHHSTTVTSPDDLLTGKITRIVNGAEVTTDFENLSPRSWYAFRWNDASQGNEANLANSQIWLDAELNTLQMNLVAAGGSFTWNTTDDVWSSRQVSDNNVHETVFRNGDFAYLGNGDTSSDMTVALGGDVVASGLTAGRDSAGSNYDGNVTITGDHGITTIKENGPGETYIIGRYAKTSGTPDPAKQEFLTSGLLNKYGTGTLTFQNTGGNLFTEGIEIHAGTVGFNNANQLLVDDGKAITFWGDGAAEATLRADAVTDLDTAVYVAQHAVGTLHTGEGKAMLIREAVSALDNSSSLAKTGEGIVQLSEDSVGFLGATFVEEGSFRVTDGVTYGAAGQAMLYLNPDAGKQAKLAGGGTLAGGTFQIGLGVGANSRSTISPDKANLTVGKLAIEGDEKYATLTLQGGGSGRTDFYSAVNGDTRDGFWFDYDVHSANDPGDPDVVTNTKNDLLILDGMNVVRLQGGVVNFHTGTNGLTTGDYLVMDSNTAFKDDSGNAFGDGTSGTTILDGIDHENGVLDGYLNGVKIVNDTPRGGYEFELRDDDKQIWLVAEHNTLTMNRSAGGDWFGSADWTSTQYVPLDGTGDLKYAKSFENGDYVKLTSASGNSYEINLNGSAIVSGMDVDSAGEITIGGVGGIRATDSDPSIEGIYVNEPWTDDRTIIPSGKLVKTGSGSLVFRNTGGNDFEKGIELGGGVTAFDRADQLGNKSESLPNDQILGSGNAITFTADSTLRADGSVTTYNETTINPGLTATFGVAADAEWKFAGNLLGDDTTTLDKTGPGTLSLYDHMEEDPPGSGIYVPTPSSFGGAVDVSAGQLAVYGDYGSTRGFGVDNGATLSGTGTIGAMTDGGVIRSGGHLAPGGLSTYTDPTAAPVENPLTVLGNLTFDAGSNFDVRITQFKENPADAKFTPYSDRVVVKDGDVEINPDAILNVDIDFWGNETDGYANTIYDYNADESGHFTIIDATDNTSYDPEQVFGTLNHSSLPRGVEMEQGWFGEGPLFQLWFVKGNGFEDICTKWNRIQIGGALDDLVWSRDPAMKDLILLLSDPEFSDPELCLILDRLTGDLTPNAMMMAMKKPWRHPFNRLELSQPTCDPCAAANSGRFKRQLWGEFYGRYDDVRDDGNAHPFEVNRNGVVVGVDQQLTRNVVVGAAFNYSDPRLSQETGRAEMDDYEIGIYGLMKLGAKYQMKWYAGYSRQNYDFDRWVHIPGTSTQAGLDERFKTKTDGDAFAASVEWIRPIHYRSNLLLLPTLAFDFEQAWMDGYREQGGLTALEYDKSSLERLMFRVGLGAEYTFRKNFGLNGRVQYATQINEKEYPEMGVRFANATTADQRTAYIRGSRIGRDYLNLGIGADWSLNTKRSLVLYINYDADLYERATIHAGEVGLVTNW